MDNTQEELRCDCGRLLFKKTRHGFEFKCNRCKRIHLIPFDAIGEDFQTLCPVNYPSKADVLHADAPSKK